MTRTSEDARLRPVPGDTYTSNQGVYTVTHVTDDHDVFFTWPPGTAVLRGYVDFMPLYTWALGSGVWAPAPTLESPCV